MSTLVDIPLESVGHVRVTTDGTETFLELSNGEETIEAEVSFDDIQSLWYAALEKEDEIRAAGRDHD